MTDKVLKVPFDNEFRVCPECGYKDGFHTMMKKEKGLIKWLFICPSCHIRFDIGYRISPDALENL